MENNMPGFFINEQKCLSNAVLQACLREQLLATWGIVPLVRNLVQKHNVPVQKVERVTLHQHPDGQGIVQYRLHLCVGDDVCHEEQFQGSGLNAQHDTFVLYDRRRDGVVEYLHLMH